MAFPSNTQRAKQRHEEERQREEERRQEVLRQAQEFETAPTKVHQRREAFLARVRASGAPNAVKPLCRQRVVRRSLTSCWRSSVKSVVILSRVEIIEHHQYKHDLAPPSRYQQVTAKPAESEAKEVIWKRPLLHAMLKLDNNRVLDLINIHLQSRLPPNILGPQVDNDTRKTPSGWAEECFLSSMKRSGQAVEMRMLSDALFDADEDALIIVCGDVNANLDEVPVEAICGDVESTGSEKPAKRVIVPCERTIPEPSWSAAPWPGADDRPPAGIQIPIGALQTF